MSRSYTFTCHTCRTVFNIGYGSSGGTCIPEWGESLEAFLERAKDNALANTRRYEEVLKAHFGHEWDTHDSEFDEDGSFERIRRGYKHEDLQERDEQAWLAYRRRIWEEAESIVAKQPDITAPDLLTLLTARHPDTEETEDTIKSWIANINNKRRGLPKELRDTLSKYESRVAARARTTEE
jgi:hypothetical protein